MDKLEKALMNQAFRGRHRGHKQLDPNACRACSKEKRPPYYVGLGYWECPFCGHINRLPLEVG